MMTKGLETRLESLVRFFFLLSFYYTTFYITFSRLRIRPGTTTTTVALNDDKGTRDAFGTFFCPFISFYYTTFYFTRLRV
jgi:hypothetical protein